MADRFLAADAVTPCPPKSERRIPYNDPYEGVQSGAAMRNRYEDGEWLPQDSRDEERAADRKAGSPIKNPRQGKN